MHSADEGGLDFSIEELNTRQILATMEPAILLH